MPFELKYADFSAAAEPKGQEGSGRKRSGPKKSDATVSVPGTKLTRAVYEGARGGKYILMDKEFVPLAKAMASAKAAAKKKAKGIKKSSSTKKYTQKGGLATSSGPLSLQDVIDLIKLKSFTVDDKQKLTPKKSTLITYYESNTDNDENENLGWWSNSTEIQSIIPTDNENIFEVVFNTILGGTNMQQVNLQDDKVVLKVDIYNNIHYILKEQYDIFQKIYDDNLRSEMPAPAAPPSDVPTQDGPALAAPPSVVPPSVVPDQAAAGNRGVQGGGMWGRPKSKSAKKTTKPKPKSASKKK